MDAASPLRPPPLQFLPHQQELIDELARIRCDWNLGNIFAGALYALRDPNNPEALWQSAHSLRELMRIMETVEFIPPSGKKKEEKDGKGSLGQKVTQLRPHWTRALKSPCHSDDRWSGEIDAKVSRLLEAVGKLFQWQENNERFRKDKSVQVVRVLDRLARHLPQKIQDTQAQEWEDLKNYFTKVSHHGMTTVAQWEACLNSLEAYLYGRLAPKAAQNQVAIQDLIKEAEGNGH